jgi:hypothetical protein
MQGSDSSVAETPAMSGLLGAETEECLFHSWISPKDTETDNCQAGSAYVLVAHLNLLPVLGAADVGEWEGSCEYPGQCNEACLTKSDGTLLRIAAVVGHRLSVILQ